MCLPSCAVLPPIALLFSRVACRDFPIPCRRVPCFRPSPGFFSAVACRGSARCLRVSPIACCHAVLPPIARPFSAVACRVSPIACRVSALRLPFFCPSPAVIPPSPAVACRASTHRPAFFRRRLPCFYLSPAVFLPVACRISARRLPSRAVLPPITQLSPHVACRASPIACRRLPCFHSSPGFFRLRLPCFCPSPAMFPPSPAVACRVSAHRSAFFPPSPALFHNKNKELRLRA